MLDVAEKVVLKEHVDAVEEREGVLGEDLLDGLGLGVGISVGEAGRDALGDLLVRKSEQIRRLLCPCLHTLPLCCGHV